MTGRNRTSRSVLRGRSVFGVATVLAMVSTIGAAQASSGLFSFLAPKTQTEWVDGDSNRARLVASGLITERFGNAVVIGVEIETSPGWKTYWRSPGDGGGMPPEFDWSQSQNLAGAEVLFPAPRRLVDTYGTSIGYKDRVVFPVIVAPQDPAQPINLVLNAIYGVCDDICIPVETRLELRVAPGLGSTEHAAQLMQHLARVPVPAGTPGAAAYNVVSTTAVLGGSTPELVVDVNFPKGTASHDLFIEGPRGVYVPMTETASSGASDQMRFRVDLRGMGDISHFAGQTLNLTVVSDSGGAEHSWTLQP